MLDGLERLQARVSDENACQLAIFFHDAVYDPSRRDNEEESARRMNEMLGGSAAEADLAAATRIILATKRHVATGDPDTDLVLDLDMAVLGAPWQDYQRYAAGVMREYVPVHGEAAYRKGRLSLFLDPSIARGAIFLTAEFRHLDARAIDNMRKEAAIMSSDTEFERWRNRQAEAGF